MAKTYAEIVANLKTNLGKLRSDVETTEGTVISDIFEVIADEIEDVYVDIEHVGVLGSFLNWDKMSDTELDDLAYNYGITRQAAVKSSGTVYFRTSTQPTQDILVAAGTVVTTEPDERFQKISFVTTSERTLDVTIVNTYYNSTTGYWELAVPVECTEAGEGGNVGVGSIKLIEGTITGIDNVYNYNAFTNGQDEESNEDLADRCLLAIQGASVGTEAGYIAICVANVNVYDALVVGPGDALMTRDSGLGGKIDIYVKVDKDSTDVYEQTSESFTYNNETEKYFANLPVKDVVSVVGSVSGTLVENTDWQFVSDTGVFRGSTQALDKINFLIAPVLGETITITYEYFDIMTTLDASVETVRPITADVLVKLADEVDIDVTATIVPDSTVTDNTALANDVQTAIESYLTFKDLNGAVEQADLIQVMKAVTGVDNITIPLTKLAKSGQSGTADIDLNENEYSNPGTITINVT